MYLINSVFFLLPFQNFIKAIHFIFKWHSFLVLYFIEQRIVTHLKLDQCLADQDAHFDNQFKLIHTSMHPNCIKNREVD